MMIETTIISRTVPGVDEASRHKLVVVDCQDIGKWGGTADDWTNATHVDQANMRRMLRYIAGHSDGALN